MRVVGPTTHLNGYLSMFYIQVVDPLPQLPPQPEREIFWKEIINEAERFEDQVDEKRGHI